MKRLFKKQEKAAEVQASNLSGGSSGVVNMNGRVSNMERSNAYSNMNIEVFEMSSMHQKFDEMFDEMLKKGEILVIGGSSQRSSASGSQGNGSEFGSPENSGFRYRDEQGSAIRDANRVSEGDIEGRLRNQSQFFSKHNSALFQSEFYTQRPTHDKIQIDSPVSVKNTSSTKSTNPFELDVEPVKESKDLECQPEPVSQAASKFKIDVKLITSLVHTRFKLSFWDSRLPELQDAETDYFKHKAGNFAKEYLAQFGEEEFREIKKIVYQASRQYRMPILNQKVFVSNFNDVQAVAETKVQTQMSLFMNDASLQDKNYLSEKTEVFLFETELVDHFNDRVQKQHFEPVSCFAMSNDQSLCFFGFSNGSILEICSGKNTSHKASLSSMITALAVSPDKEYFAAGSASSELMFKKTDGRMAKKTVSSLNSQKILQIAFIDHSKLLVGTSHAVFYFRIKNYMMTLTNTSTLFHTFSGSGLVQIASYQENQMFKVCISDSTSVTLYTIYVDESKDAPKIMSIGNKIEEPSGSRSAGDPDWPPSIDWITNSTPYLLILWRKVAMVVKFDSETYTIRSQSKLEKEVVWGKILDNRIVCYISEMEMHFLSIDRIFSTATSGENVYMCMPLDQRILKNSAETSLVNKFKGDLLASHQSDENRLKHFEYFRFFKDRIRKVGKDVVMLTEVGLIRYYLVSFVKMIQGYIRNNQHVLAIRILNSIFLGRITPSDEEKKELKGLVIHVVCSYVQKNFSQRVEQQDLKNILDIVLECLAYSGHEDYIFKEVRPLFEPSLFWSEVSKCVRQKRIKCVPMMYLPYGLDYLHSEEVVDLLQSTNFDESPDKDLLLSQIFAVVKKKDLWVYFYKLCLVSPENSVPLFLTMLSAELINLEESRVKEIVLMIQSIQPHQGPVNGYFIEDPIRKNFFRIFWFMNLVLTPHLLEKSVGFFTDNPAMFRANIPKAYAAVLDWILSKGNIKMLAATCAPFLFEVLAFALLNTELLSQPATIAVLNSHKHLQDAVKEKSPILAKSSSSSPSSPNKKSQSISEGKHFSRSSIDLAREVSGAVDSLLEHKYSVEVAFLQLRVLIFSVFDEKYEDVTFVCRCICTLMSEDFLEGRFWLDYRPLEFDTFENMIIDLCLKMENKPRFELYRSDLGQVSLKHG